jgi:carboxymethylenebutenolidase
MPGTMIDFRANGRTAQGYLSKPASAKAPGVLVMQEWWGLVGHIRDVVDRFASEGFVALAPDLYHGEQTKSPDDAGKLMMALDIAETTKDLSGAADYLLALDSVTPKKLGIVGFCMGGQLALYGACTLPEKIGAAVDFYGIHPKVNPDVTKLSGPVLAHFGREDHSIPVKQVEELERRAERAGKRFEVHWYDAGHAFFNDQRPTVYSPDDAKVAWQRTIDFLNAALR